MLKTRISLAAAVAVLVGTLPLPAGAAIVVGQIDDFEAGGLQNWSGGDRNPNPPTNIGSGGPGGAGDNYLRLRSNGGNAGGKLVVFNTLDHQWTGDYLGAGVTSIRMQVNNLGTTDLVLRLILEHGLESLTTQSPVSLPAGAGWKTVAFSLAPDNLAGGDYQVVMGDVDWLNLLHSPNVVSHRTSAPEVVAQLGVDNIAAVPEPSTLALLGLGMLGLLAWRRKRP